MKVAKAGSWEAFSLALTPVAFTGLLGFAAGEYIQLHGSHPSPGASSRSWCTDSHPIPQPCSHLRTQGILV